MRSQFNLSHEHKTTVEMGQLIPVQVDEVLPGDTFMQQSTALTRVAPLAHPLMHRVELRMHSFYVPNRILWDGWEDFITGQPDAAAMPLYTTTVDDQILDFMGIPPVAGLNVQELPIRAYNMIWNEYFRDQDLQVEEDLLNTNIKHICWQKDYFTVCRPSPQLGDPETIPITGQGRIGNIWRSNQEADNLLPGITPEDPNWLGEDAPSPGHLAILGGSGRNPRLSLEEADASIHIDDLRRSIALQRFAEARMRFGSRYVDYLRYIGVNPSDGRLDRPEYLGGGKEVLSFSEVLSTAEVAEANVGDMYGHGIGMGRTNGFNKMFEEHGWVLTLLSARPKTVYSNALPRKFTRDDPMEFWQKELEVMPWQEVYQQEVDANGDANTVFGYVPRYEEYRHGCSHVSGTMRNGPEKDWHMARDFGSPPSLNGSFVNCDPTTRIYQDANMPDLVVNVHHNIQARRFVGQTASMGTDL